MVVPVEFVMSLSPFGVMLSSQKLATDIIICTCVTVMSSMTSFFGSVVGGFLH